MNKILTAQCLLTLNPAYQFLEILRVALISLNFLSPSFHARLKNFNHSHCPILPFANSRAHNEQRLFGLYTGISKHTYTAQMPIDNE